MNHNSSSPAQPIAPPNDGRFDVHAHFLTDRYRAEASAAGHSQPDGMPGLPVWSVELALQSMDRFGISTAMLSVSSPGVHFGDDDAARALARSVNEEAAAAVRAYPERFGHFASLPLPDVKGALAEIEFAFDVLHVDGVVLETNHHGIYLGDDRFDSVFAELNRRKAVVFIHPTSPNCTCCQNPSLGFPRPMVEFMFETTRAVSNLLLKGVLKKHPDIKLIIPHAGAALPILVDRIIGLSPALGLDEPVEPDEVFSQLRKLYFDLAGFPVPRLLPALLSIADPDKLLYGSDWPFTPNAIVESLIQKLAETDQFDEAFKRKIFSQNAHSLFSRFARR
jgi:predicted TIM-barrel fold metal-dependent hydrolase